ncbi:hypothetical protein [Labilibaculum sp.]|uniref:hypothetical protein n=1 Tax=Labilibaculum sp. TaxID=2060723 RepID=UPI0035680B9B
MQTLKSYLKNLQTQIKILIGFYLENEVLLSHQLIQIMDQAQLDLKDLLQIKAELDRKINWITFIETIANHPRYFVLDTPGKLIATYTQKEDFRKISPALSTFLVYANSIADIMYKSNSSLIENLPPLYQSILNQSRKNKQEGFHHALVKIIYETPYPDILAAEYIRITTLLYDTYKSKTSLQLILSTLNQEF